jgi:hypothetical protein
MTALIKIYPIPTVNLYTTLGANTGTTYSIFPIMPMKDLASPPGSNQLIIEKQQEDTYT